MDPTLIEKLNVMATDGFASLINRIAVKAESYRQSNPGTELRFDQSPSSGPTLYHRGFVCSIAFAWFGRPDKSERPGMCITFKGPDVEFQAFPYDECNEIRWAKRDPCSDEPQQRWTTEQLADMIFECSTNPNLIERL
ncbi:MAG: hypothetical protein JST01_26235 [Cyanobacteria bacterium SZAS TMP-1]|nr:hypothetical protein [Cyanobacteria bacterium SZAS TMP-1]